MDKIKQILKKEAYYDESFFEKEKTNIFEKTWQFVCMKEELQKDKSFILRDIGNTSIVILNNNGKLNAFINMCTHRGMRLLRGDEKLTSSIICPYHNWNFDTEGNLKGIPQAKEFPHMDKSCMGAKKSTS